MRSSQALGAVLLLGALAMGFLLGFGVKFAIGGDGGYSSGYLQPPKSGYQPKADAYFSHQAPVGTMCTNELVDSHSFTNATYWGDVSTYWTMATSQSDPWGGTTAVKFTATASPLGINVTEVNRWQHGGDITFSAYIKKGTLGTTDRSELDLRNNTDSISHWLRVTWASTPVFAKSAYCSDGGFVSLGGSWYQIWGTFDNTADATDDMYIRINLCTTPVEGDEFYIVGAQVEFGVTEPCGTYVEKP